MADEGRIARIKPGAEPKLVYAAPMSTEKVMDWQMGPGGSMKNYDEYMRPREIGDLQHSKGGSVTRPQSCKGDKMISSRRC